MEGVPVVGGRDDILWAAKKYKVDKIFLTMPSATAEQKRDILNICNETGCELKQLPGLYQFMTGQVTVSQMKNAAIEDLLGREKIAPDLKEVYDYINGKVVLPVPELSGHTFDGWFDGEVAVNSDTVFDSDVTLVAQWTENSSFFESNWWILLFIVLVLIIVVIVLYKMRTA